MPETRVQYVQGPGSMSELVTQTPALCTTRTQEEHGRRHTGHDKCFRGTTEGPQQGSDKVSSGFVPYFILFLRQGLMEPRQGYSLFKDDLELLIPLLSNAGAFRCVPPCSVWCSARNLT